VSPGIVGGLIGWAGQLLPKPGDDEAPGFQAAAATSTMFDRLTVLARRAVRRLNQAAAHYGVPAARR
jgi:hypothetical protein